MIDCDVALVCHISGVRINDCSSFFVDVMMMVM